MQPAHPLLDNSQHAYAEVATNDPDGEEESQYDHDASMHSTMSIHDQCLRIQSLNRASTIRRRVSMVGHASPDEEYDENGEVIKRKSIIFEEVDPDAHLIEEEEAVRSPFHFVEAGWFQALVAVVIGANVVMIVLEAQDPSLEEQLKYPELATLLFYILELYFRSMFFGRLLICGPPRFVAWTMLDVAVVGAGITEFLLQFMPEHIEKTLATPMKVLLMLRLVRVLKIVRIFLETDLYWTESAWFQSFIGLVISFNAFLMGLETDIEWAGWMIIEQVLLIIYSFELLCRVKKTGWFFFSWNNPDFNWNWLDSAIVGSSAADSWLFPLIALIMEQINFPAAEEQETNKHAQRHSGGLKLSQLMMLMRMLRLMRILRLVKLVKTVEPLYILVTGVAAAVQGVTWVLILTIVILYAISILATRLIGHGLVFPDPNNVPVGVEVFKTVPDSMFTLFRVMSGAQSDEESTKLDTLMHALPTIKFAFVFFMVTSSWTLLSILTAVVSENMISTCGTQQEELRMISHEEDRMAHMEDLKCLFKTMDANDNGELEFRELEEVLQSKEMAASVAKLVRVPVRNVREVFKTLSRHGTTVSMDMFVENMLEVAKPVTEQSVMKIQAQILDTGRDHTAEMSKLISNVKEVIDRHNVQFMQISTKMDKLTSAFGSLAETQRRMDASNTTAISQLQASMDSLCQMMSRANNASANTAEGISADASQSNGPIRHQNGNLAHQDPPCEAPCEEDHGGENKLPSPMNIHCACGESSNHSNGQDEPVSRAAAFVQEPMETSTEGSAHNGNQDVRELLILPDVANLVEQKNAREKVPIVIPEVLHIPSTSVAETPTATSVVETSPSKRNVDSLTRLDKTVNRLCLTVDSVAAKMQQEGQGQPLSGSVGSTAIESGSPTSPLNSRKVDELTRNLLYLPGA